MRQSGPRRTSGLRTDGVHTVKEALLIVVPYREHHIPQPLTPQLRGQETTQEVPLLLRRIYAGLPGLDGVRLILYGHGEDVVPAFPILQRITAHILRPALTEFGAKLTAPRALRVVLHVFRRRPGREQQSQIRAGFDDVVQHGKDVLSRALKRKVLKRRIRRCRICTIGLQRKVTAVNVAPGERVSKPI